MADGLFVFVFPSVNGEDRLEVDYIAVIRNHTMPRKKMTRKTTHKSLQGTHEQRESEAERIESCHRCFRSMRRYTAVSARIQANAINYTTKFEMLSSRDKKGITFYFSLFHFSFFFHSDSFGTAVSRV